MVYVRIALSHLIYRSLTVYMVAVRQAECASCRDEQLFYSDLFIVYIAVIMLEVANLSSLVTCLTTSSGKYHKGEGPRKLYFICFGLAACTLVPNMQGFCEDSTQSMRV